MIGRRQKSKLSFLSGVNLIKGIDAKIAARFAHDQFRRQSTPSRPAASVGIHTSACGEIGTVGAIDALLTEGLT